MKPARKPARPGVFSTGWFLPAAPLWATPTLLSSTTPAQARDADRTAAIAAGDGVEAANGINQANGASLPERVVDMGIVPESTQGGGHILFEHSAYIPRGAHDGAHFYADDTEFTLQIYIRASGGFDPNQTYQLKFKACPTRCRPAVPTRRRSRSMPVPEPNRYSHAAAEGRSPQSGMAASST